MSVSDADIAFAVDLMSPIADLTTRKMFGGLGIYSDGVIFALLSSEGRLFLKATGAFAQALQSGGSQQFHSMPYWSMPEAALDDPQEATALARRALSDLID